MDLEQEFKKETGFDAYIDNNLEPKIPMGYYVEWLEAKIDYAHSSTQFPCKEEKESELKKLIEDCCNEIDNKIEPLANVKSRLYESLKPAINYTRSSYKLSDKLPQSFEDWRKENCKQLAENMFDFKGNVYDGYDLMYVYMREVKHEA